ncbi:hypothetical protein G4228_006767 [Cervus hanglu yarkandensis]|nr:hypothetical protein G4228_006767 [Cervus hanglu yarkandensis]
MGAKLTRLVYLTDYCKNLKFCFLLGVKQVIHIEELQGSSGPLDAKIGRLGDGLLNEEYATFDLSCQNPEVAATAHRHPASEDVAFSRDVACGQRPVQGRILGGVDALERKWPWQVSVHYTGFHICGGSIVDEYWILSAAHCFDRALQKIHTEVKLYKCNEFQKMFAQKTHLSTHQRIHTGEKPYECCECGKTFSQKSYLSERIHKGEKPYECHECGKTSSQRTHLCAHQKTHTGMKPYKCEEYGKTFADNLALRTHQRIHKME